MMNSYNFFNRLNYNFTRWMTITFEIAIKKCVIFLGFFILQKCSRILVLRSASLTNKLHSTINFSSSYNINPIRCSSTAHIIIIDYGKLPTIYRWCNGSLVLGISITNSSLWLFPSQPNFGKRQVRKIPWYNHLWYYGLGITHFRNFFQKQLSHSVSFAGIWRLHLGVLRKLHTKLWFGLN